ncbi:MAG: glutamyl-tRNA reductase, partial [Elusimicrobia bacterium]|nr:glutamyl-tRNA reductase [Elusimicrobiota bacterium]
MAWLFMMTDHLLFAVGASHKSVSLSMLELLARKWMGNMKEALLEISQATRGSARELCLLSTCNRLEIYGVGSLDSTARLKEMLMSSLPGAGPAGVYALPTNETLRHAFWVASGLDSMVIGETEILGQMKSAYEAAREAGFTKGVLNTMFQRALCVGKRVRSETRLSLGRLSVASVAVELA